MTTARAARPTGSARLAGCAALLALLIAGCGAGTAPPDAPPPASAPASTPPAASPPASAAPEASAPVAGPAELPKPTRVIAASIGIDEPLIELGLDTAGAAEVPADYDDAGWFAAGGRPGAFGPTVLLGHVDSQDGPAVFFRLREMRAGDEILISVEDGSTARYVVTDVSTYSKDAFPTFAVYGATLDDVLRLVTCGGDFDRSQSRYLDNVVVSAERA